VTAGCVAAGVCSIVVVAEAVAPEQFKPSSLYSQVVENTFGTANTSEEFQPDKDDASQEENSTTNHNSIRLNTYQDTCLNYHAEKPEVLSLDMCNQSETQKYSLSFAQDIYGEADITPVIQQNTCLYANDANFMVSECASTVPAWIFQTNGLIQSANTDLCIQAADTTTPAQITLQSIGRQASLELGSRD